MARFANTASVPVDADDVRPILVVGPAWVGDMIMAQSLFRALKARWPGRPIDVLAPRATLPVLDFMAEVRAGIEQPLGHGRFGLAARRRLGRHLRDRRYGTAYILPRSWKSALVPFFARVPERIGYWGEARLGLLTCPRKLDKADLPLTVQRFTALAGPPGATAPEIEKPRLAVPDGAAEAALAALDLARPEGPLLALCPGAEYGPSKRWPAHHGGTLARQAIAAGWTVWLFGGPGDREIAEDIMAAAGAGMEGRLVDLTGRTSLAQAFALLSLADRVVSNDSGLMHAAAALDRPLVALFGSSSPDHTPPLSDRAQVIRLGLDCQPCFQRTCPLGHLGCLEGITPDMVLAAVGRTAP